MLPAGRRRTLAPVQLHRHLRQHAVKGRAGVVIVPRGSQRRQRCQQRAQRVGADQQAAVLKGARNKGLIHW
jgi:hypothetical protein